MNPLIRIFTEVFLSRLPVPFSTGSMFFGVLESSPPMMIQIILIGFLGYTSSLFASYILGRCASIFFKKKQGLKYSFYIAFLCFCPVGGIFAIMCGMLRSNVFGFLGCASLSFIVYTIFGNMMVI